MSPDRDRRGDPQAGCCARHRRPGFHRRAILDAVNNGKTDDAVISLEWTSAALFTRPTRHQPPEIAVLPCCRRTGLGTTRRDRHPARRARPTRRGSHQRWRHAVRPAGLLAAAHHQVPVTFVIASNEQYGVLAGFSRMLNVPEVSRHTAPDRRDTSKPQVKRHDHLLARYKAPHADTGHRVRHSGAVSAHRPPMPAANHPAAQPHNGGS
jgi:hypothetical protein